MKIGILAAGTLTAMLAAVPAFGFDETPAGASDGTTPTASTTVRCRRYAAPTGSRIGGARVCRTETEWSIIDREMEEQLESAGVRNRFANTLGKSPQCPSPAC